MYRTRQSGCIVCCLCEGVSGFGWTNVGYCWSANMPVTRECDGCCRKSCTTCRCISACHTTATVCSAEHSGKQLISVDCILLDVSVGQGTCLCSQVQPVEQLRQLLTAAHGADSEAVKAFFQLHKVSVLSMCVFVDLQSCTCAKTTFADLCKVLTALWSRDNLH